MAFEIDPYRTLGLARGATIEEVRRAYRRLAKVNHPDAAGPAALSRFLSIQAAYEQIAGGSAGSGAGRRGTATPRPRASAADSGQADATRRAYGGRPRRDPDRAQPGSGNAGRQAGSGGPRPRSAAGRSDQTGAAGSRESPTGGPRGKATLGSTSYDGADGGPFEPDWGGASWYGTTSGTYWTINPKEYADPRKHGPEYQARARRAPRSGAPGQSAADGRQDAEPDRAADPTHTTSSWWESTSGSTASPGSRAPASGTTESTEPARGRAQPADPFDAGEPPPDPARAAIDLGRALTDPHSGGMRGRVVRALLGWFPIAFGLGWLVGELSGCGRFAATCDPAVVPLTAVGQATILVALLLLPEIASLAAGAALALLVAAVAASLVLSATGTAADEGSRRAALGTLLLVSWVSGLAVAIVRRVRSRPATSGPVS